MGSVRFLNHRNSIRLILSALCIAGAGMCMRPASAAAVTQPAAPAIQTFSGHSSDSVQLADEITRRLRRMGISFSRSRVAHPYDDGEVC